MTEIKKLKGELVTARNSNSGNNNQSYELASFKGVDLASLFNDFVAFIQASPATVRTYTTSLRQWFKYMNDNQIYSPAIDDILNYKAYLLETKKPATVQSYLIAVKRFFNWTEFRGFYPNITKHVKGVKVSKNFNSAKDPLTTEQARNVLKVFNLSTQKGLRDYAMFALMITCGLRTIEVSTACIEDIRNVGDNTVLYIKGKGHLEKDDFVPLPDHIHRLINRYLETREKATGVSPLFASISHRNSEKAMTTRSIRRIVKGAYRAAGYDSPRLTAHSTRHTAATLSLLSGASVQETQRLLRHKNFQTTEIYAQNIEAAKNEASRKVDAAIFG